MSFIRGHLISNIEVQSLDQVQLSNLDCSSLSHESSDFGLVRIKFISNLYFSVSLKPDVEFQSFDAVRNEKSLQLHLDLRLPGITMANGMISNYYVRLGLF